MITIYQDTNCCSCEYLILSLKLCNIDYKILKIRELTIDYNKIPVVKINDIYISDYVNFNDLLNKIQKFDIDISLKKIYDKLLEIIYNEDEDYDIFIKLYKVKEIRFHYEKGFLLAHHIVSSTNNNLLKYLMINHHNELNSYLTKTYIFNNQGFVICQTEDQTILHVSAQFNNDIYVKILNHVKDTPDSLGYFAKDILENRNNAMFISNINKRILNQYQIKFNTEKIIDDIFIDNEMRNVFVNKMKQNQTAPNSMHKFGYVFDKEDQDIKKFVEKLDKNYNLLLEGKKFNIHAFIVEYSKDFNNYLDMHKDDSIITINWNLEVSDDIDGTDLIVPFNNLTFFPKKNRLLIHHGKIEHQVTKLKNGSRKNLIIWLK